MTAKPPLGIPIPIMGITGDIYSGKTILALSIAPGAFADGPNKGNSRTLYIDFEQSGASYEGAGAKRIDAPGMLRSQWANAAYKPIDVFNWFRAFIANIPPGSFDVIVVDPITDVEDGLVDYVQAHPGEFGYTKDQFASGGGLLWGAVKNFWKLILVDLSARAQMFVFVSHMRMEFRGGRPTGQLKPKGKETLAEIASLYLQLSRDKTRNEEKPQPPSAIILKERLSITRINEKSGELEVIKMLPDRLPIATAKAIRHYIEHPVGTRKLKPEELIQEEHLSDDDKLILQAEIEKAKADAETKRLELWALQRVPLAPPGTVGPPAFPQVPPVIATIPATVPSTTLPPVVAAPPTPPPNTVPAAGGALPPGPVPPAPAAPTDPELQTILLQVRELGRGLYGTPDRFGPAFVEFFAKKGKSYNDLNQMTLVEALDYKANLKLLIARENINQKHGYPSVIDPPPAANPTPPPPANEGELIEPMSANEPMTPEQLEQLKALCSPSTAGAMSSAEQDTWLAEFKVERMRDITQGQFQFLMNRRSARLSARATPPAPETPSTSS